MTEQQPEPEQETAETEQRPEREQPQTRQSPEQETEQQTEPEADEQVKALRAEARGYRQKASAAKAEAEGMRGLAESYVRRTVESMVSDRLTRPGLLWQLGGVTPLDLLTEDHEIDAERVDEAVNATVEQVPEARPAPHHGDMGAKRRKAPVRSERGFGDVLKGRGL